MTQLVRRNSIDFGKIDAKSAMTSRDATSRKLFMDSFAIPPTFDKAAFVAGDRYLIYGAKGSGKTALLRYMMEEEKTKGSATKFVVFDEDISQQEMNSIASQINFESVDKPDIEGIIDVRDIWVIFLIKCICDLMCSNSNLANDVGKIAKFREIIVNSIGSADKTALSRIAAHIKSGTLRFKAGFSDIAGLEAELNLERGDEGMIDFSRFSEKALSFLCGLRYPEDVRYCLFIDELNLSMLEKKQHKKDSILIRDLVQAVGYLNRIFSERGIPVFLYAAVRIEVAKAINVSRNEIDKYLIDHGQRIQWHVGFDISRYPIFTVIEQRIMATEKNVAGRSNTAEQIWKDYFSRDVFGTDCKQFLSEVTWCNPRDIVNLFNLASAALPNRSYYDTEVFRSIAHEYSERVWSERSEELNAEHAMTVVNAIKRLLSGGFHHFKIETLKKRALGLARSDQVIGQVCQTVGIEKICRDLYHVGIIGQSLPQRGSKVGDKPTAIVQTWFYRDNIEFDASQWMIVHLGLYPCLKLATNWRADMFGLDPRTISTLG